MLKIVYKKAPVLAEIVSENKYLSAINIAEEISQKYGLFVADVPLLIQNIDTHPEIREAIWRLPTKIDTITSEYFGFRKSVRFYEVWHSAGTLSTAEGLKKMFPLRSNSLIDISNDEWVQVDKGSYDGQTIERRHLDDVKKGDVPSPGTPYTIFVRPDKDKFGFSLLDNFMCDNLMQKDRFLMYAGNLENADALDKIFNDEMNKRGKKQRSFKIKRDIFDDGFYTKNARGRMVYFNFFSWHDFLGYRCNNVNGCFVVLGDIDEVELEKNVYSNENTRLNLEQTLAVINNPNLNRKGMVKAIKQIYKQ